MAILVIWTGAGIDKSQYEAVRKEVGWERNPPQGVILQAAGFDQKGIHVADLWESQQALDNFVSQRLNPALKKLEVPTPQVEVYPVHNANAYPGVDQYKAKQSVR